jgi:flagellar hook-associated protein 1
VPSTFGSLSLAASALAAQRRALDVTGQNIANVNTDGYSRQRVELRALAQRSAGVHVGGSQSGSGVDVAAQIRVVDRFLTERADRERAALGRAEELADAHRRVEVALQEPGEQGLAAGLEGLWDAFDAVAARPEDLSARAALLQRIEGVVGTFATLTRALSDLAGDALQRADAVVGEVNAIAERLAALNGDIAAAGAQGAPPNELLDERDRLVAQLAGHVGVRTAVDDRGVVSVSVSGYGLVGGTRAGALALDASTPDAPVIRSGAGGLLEVHGGGLGGLLEVAGAVVPAQRARLDAVATGLVGLVNAQHRLGQDLADPPQPGGDLLTGTGAGDLALAPGVAGHPERVAAAPLGAGRFDGGNARALALLGDTAGGPDEVYRSLVARLGIESATAADRAALQEQVVAQVEADRQEVSGVSLDEEMANMIAYQQAYQASARFLTVVDELIQRLVDGTGLVGR